MVVYRHSQKQQILINLRRVGAPASLPPVQLNVKSSRLASRYFSSLHNQQGSSTIRAYPGFIFAS